MGVGGIGQIFCRGRRDWSSFLREREGLVELSVGVDGIGLNFYGSGWDGICQTFLQECVGSSKLSLYLELVEYSAGVKWNKIYSPLHTFSHRSRRPG